MNSLAARDVVSPRIGGGDESLRRNNFDLLRLLFAATVCISHVHALSGYAPLAWLTNFFSPVAAVKAFFVVSGFLIFMSYERSSSLHAYLDKRLRRIYPAYCSVVLLCAGLFWVVSADPLDRYFSLGWLKYVAANLVFLNFLAPGLPGVFEEFRYPVINGALWTLKIEVMFYLCVPILAMLGRRWGYGRVLALAYAGSVAYATALGALAVSHGSPFYAELARQLPGQLSYFAGGAFFYYYLPLFARYRMVFALSAVTVLILNAFFPLTWLEPFALATLVAFCGLFFYVGNAGKYGDFSYGIYILHFPIIQLLLHARWCADSPYAFLVSAVGLTFVGAVLMWHLVEKRFLFRSSHYLAATGRGSPA